MKTFDEVEKEIIKEILDDNGRSRNLMDIFDKYFIQESISFNKTNNSAEIIFNSSTSSPSQQEIDSAIERERSLTELLVKFLTLLLYLEREDLAVFFLAANSTNNPVTFGRAITNNFTFAMPVYDQSIITLLIKYAELQIMPFPSLRGLYKNNFLSDDELRFKKNQRTSWVAIVISILIGLYGVYINFTNNNDQDKKFENQLNKNSEHAKLISEKIYDLGKSNYNYNTQLATMAEGISKISSSLNEAIAIQNINETKTNKRKQTKAITNNCSKKVRLSRARLGENYVELSNGQQSLR
jgi:hypothetical protein